MADSDLIQDAVQPVGGSSGVSLDTGVGSLQNAGNAINKLMGQVRADEEYKESYRRKQNEDIAKSDMTSFSAFLTDQKTQFDIELSKAQTREQMDKIVNNYRKTVNGQINGSNAAGVPYFRNRMGKDKATEYLKGYQTQITRQMELQHEKVTQKQNIDNYEYAISHIKQNPLDPQYLDKLEAIYDNLIELGPDVMNEGEKRERLMIDKKQQIRGVADNATAIFQTHLNKLAEDYNTEIGRIQTIAANEKLSAQEADILIKAAIKRYETGVNSQVGEYKKVINGSELTNTEKRSYLKSVDTNTKYADGFMKQIQSQMKEQQVRQENFAIQSFQDWQVKNPSQMAPLNVLRQAGLPDDYINAYQKSWIGINRTKAKAASDKLEDKREAFNSMKDSIAIARNIDKRLQNLNPYSPPELFKQMRYDLLQITNTKLQTQIEARIKQKEDKAKYLQPLEDVLSARSATLEGIFKDFDLSIPGWNNDRALRLNEIEEIKFNISQMARKEYEKTGDMQKAIDFVSREYNKLEDEETQQGTVNQYLDRNRGFDQNDFIGGAFSGIQLQQNEYLIEQTQEDGSIKYIIRNSVTNKDREAE